ncbi:hypothetical protein AB2L28_17525 [Kineococcus sp. TBRC 1896]|uniref:VCBS repeat protein n=1 Tax=Kineococcus mangrovi TaxID=1660183 RepID=A0ABV4I682_9ACTN
MNTRRTRALALTSLAALALTAGCSDTASDTASGTGGSPTTPPVTSSTSPTTSSAATTSTSTASATSSVDPGATGPTAGVPDGAGTATTVDLDGDGRPDTVWLNDTGDDRVLGVTTTSHGTVFTNFTSAAPQPASVSAAVLASGAPVVFLDTGRSVQLHVYRVEGPALSVVRGVEGDPYSFSLGFTPYGTGLTCRAQSDGLHLYGENAVADGGTFTLTRTEVHVSAEHSVAQNGDTTTVGTGLSADDPLVRAARGTTCGDGGVAHEPR